MTSTIVICQLTPVDLLPPTLQEIPEAIDKNIAIALARTRSRIMAVVKSDGYGHRAIAVPRPRSPPEQNGSGQQVSQRPWNFVQRGSLRNGALPWRMTDNGIGVRCYGPRP